MIKEKDFINNSLPDGYDNGAHLTIETIEDSAKLYKEISKKKIIKEEDIFSDSNLSQFSQATCNLIKEKKEDIVSKAIDEMGMTTYQFKILLFGLLVTFSYGAEIVVVSLITRKLEKIWHLTDLKKASLGGALFYGYFLGALISGSLINSKGRKFCFTIGSWLFIFFGISSAFSNEFYSFMFYRTGVGLGVGIIIPTTITYMTEMTPTLYRGFICNIIWLGYSMGELYICLIAKYFPLDSKFSQQSNWTVVLIFASLPILINLILLNFIFESPRFCFQNNSQIEGLVIINEMKTDADLPLLNKEEKKEYIKYYDFQKITKNLSSIFTLFNENNRIISIQLGLMTFVISFLFFGLIYLIPELVGKTAENINFHDLVRTVVYATVFESLGVFCAFMMEFKNIGRIGALKISFVTSFLFSLICLIANDIRKYSYFIFILKGAITVAHRVFVVYLPECYSAEIRGQALGLSQSLTKVLGITTPIICQTLISFSVISAISGLTIACLVGVILSYTLSKETLNTKMD